MANDFNKQANRVSRIKKKRRRRKRLLSFLLIIALSGFSYAGYVAFHAFNAVNNSYAEVEGREDEGKSDLREEPVYVSSDPFSVLLLGIEDYSDEYDHGRSDTIMVATFNPENQTMKLLSIPRDTMVKIPEFGRDKINHAFADGGKEKVIETVEEFLDIPIDYYVTVNFDGFTNIVDVLGGVTVDVPFDFDDINNDWERFYFKEGTQKLNGEEALVYARMRMKDPRGDFGRNERQRQIITSLIDQLSSPKTLMKIDDIAAEIGDNIETNMKVKEGLAFRKKYSDFNSSKIEQLELKGYDETIRRVYYFMPDEENVEDIKSTLQTHLEIRQEFTDNSNETDNTDDNTPNDSSQ
jgi:polyisoprenyl-teichoic acid--peptidoglycan teichoic acid transferase